MEYKDLLWESLNSLSIGIGVAEGVSSPQIMYHFSIEFLELAVSCLGLGEGGCDCTALAMH